MVFTMPHVLGLEFGVPALSAIERHRKNTSDESVANFFLPSPFFDLHLHIPYQV